ncbi:spermidine synthase [Cohnella kolymensis]|uniref:Spermidine synthase n=1 Tax=Cohnella kolymensis TaxID=1590652 RepID=A0ABR5A7S1_9BACL|nr:spermidine synthase [Cohnella kolymensis]
MHILAKELSKFNEIVVFETTELYGKLGKFRCLRFADEAIEGVVDLKNPERVVLEYQKAVFHLMEFNAEYFQNVFIIGHGIGMIAGHYPDKRIKVAEIDAQVLEVSRRFFNYRMDNVVIGDGREILSNEESQAYDFIIMDAFTQKGTPMQFTTLEFFKLTSEKLDSQGLFIMNLMGKAKNDRYTDAIFSTLKEAYRFTRAFFLPGANAADTGNIIIAGSNRTIEFQPNEMGGFIEIDLGQGHLIMDG